MICKKRAIFSLFLMISTTLRAVMIYHYSVMDKKSRINMIRLFLVGEARYAPVAQIFRFALRKRASDVSRSNANQHACQSKHLIRIASDPQHKKRPTTRVGVEAGYCRSGWSFLVITLILLIVCAISSPGKIPPRRYAAQRWLRHAVAVQLLSPKKKTSHKDWFFLWWGKLDSDQRSQ